MLNDDLAILSAWNIGAIHAVSTPTNGTINRTLLVDSATGRYVLRAYRHAERAPVAREHTVIAHVIAHGLPAIGLCELPSGETILECDGRFYALFSHAPGAQIARPDLTIEHMAAMGAFLAQLHVALHDFPIGQAARRDFIIDRNTTLTGIEQIEAVVRTIATPNEIDQWVLMQLADRRAWLAQSPFNTLPDILALDQQVIHGDYQETNLFFQNGSVSAIIDWDQTYVASREWEIARTLDLTCHFEQESARAFLDGYRAHAPLDLAALDLAATAYALMRAHDLWLYRAIYFQNNQRIRQFIAHGGFVPLLDRWAALHEALRSEKSGSYVSMYHFNDRSRQRKSNDRYTRPTGDT